MTGHSLGKVNALLKETEVDSSDFIIKNDRDIESYFDLEKMDEIDDMDGLET